MNKVILTVVASLMMFTMPAKAGLGSVFFETDKDVISQEQLAELKTLAEQLVKQKAQIVIVGNADKRGERLYNLDLGERRAKSVLKALSEAGVPAEQMVISLSQGEEKPSAPNDSIPAHLAQNRRVDILSVESTEVVKEEIIVVTKEKEVVRRHRVALLGGFAPSGVNNAVKIAPNTFIVKEDFDVEVGGSYSFLTPLLDNRVSVTIMGFTNKSGFVGVGFEF